MNLNVTEIKSLVWRYLEGDALAIGEGMHVRSDGRGGLYRLPLESGGTVVVKVWLIRNLKERVKYVARISNGLNEWNIHRLVYNAGIATSKPIAFYRMPMRNGTSCEVLVVEDLGETVSSLSWLKQLISRGDESKVVSFEDKLIEITARFIDLHILDIDHQLNNFVVDAHSRLMRVDFECARKHLFSLKFKKDCVKMIARFLTGHVHAVQPDVDRSARFAERLYAKVHIGHRMKAMVNENVNANLTYQLTHSGVDTKVSLPV